MWKLIETKKREDTKRLKNKLNGLNEYMKLLNKRILKIIALALIQAVVAGNLAWCGAGDIVGNNQQEQVSTLAPKININAESFKSDFLKARKDKNKQTVSSNIVQKTESAGLPIQNKPPVHSAVEGGESVTRRDFLKGLGILAAAVAGWKISEVASLADTNSHEKLTLEERKKREQEIKQFVINQLPSEVKALYKRGERGKARDLLLKMAEEGKFESYGKDSAFTDTIYLIPIQGLKKEHGKKFYVLMGCLFVDKECLKDREIEIKLADMSKQKKELFLGAFRGLGFLGAVGSLSYLAWQAVKPFNDRKSIIAFKRDEDAAFLKSRLDNMSKQRKEITDELEKMEGKIRDIVDADDIDWILAEFPAVLAYEDNLDSLRDKINNLEDKKSLLDKIRSEMEQIEREENIEKERLGNLFQYWINGAIIENKMKQIASLREDLENLSSAANSVKDKRELQGKVYDVKRLFYSMRGKITEKFKEKYGLLSEKAKNGNFSFHEIAQDWIHLEDNLKKYKALGEEFGQYGITEQYLKNMLGAERRHLSSLVIDKLIASAELNITYEVAMEFVAVIKDLILNNASGSKDSVALGYALLKLAEVDSKLKVELSPLVIMNSYRERGTSGEWPFVGMAGLSNNSALFKFITALTEEEIGQIKKEKIDGLVEFITIVRNNSGGINSRIENPLFVLFEKKFVTNGYLDIWHENPDYFYSRYKENSDFSYLRNQFSDYLQAYRFKDKKVEEEKIFAKNDGVLTVKEAIEKTLEELGLKFDDIKDETIPNPEYQRLHLELKKMFLQMLKDKDEANQIFAMDYFEQWQNELKLEDTYSAMKGILESSSNEALKKSIISILENKILYGDKDSLSAILKIFNPDLIPYSEDVKILSAFNNLSFLIEPILSGALNNVIKKVNARIHLMAPQSLEITSNLVAIPYLLEMLNIPNLRLQILSGLIQILNSNRQQMAPHEATERLLTPYFSLLSDHDLMGIYTDICSNLNINNITDGISSLNLVLVMHRYAHEQRSLSLPIIEIPLLDWNNLAPLLNFLSNVYYPGIDEFYIPFLRSFLEEIIVQLRLGIDGAGAQIEIAFPQLWQARDRLISLLLDSEPPIILKRHLRILIKLLPRNVNTGTAANEEGSLRRLAVDAETEQMRLPPEIQNEIRQRWVNAGHDGNIHEAVHDNPGRYNLALCEDIIEEFRKLGRAEEEYANLLNLRNALQKMYNSSGNIALLKEEIQAWETQIVTSLPAQDTAQMRKELDGLSRLKIEENNFFASITQIREMLYRDIINNANFSNTARVATYMFDLYLETLQYKAFALQIEKLRDITDNNLNIAIDLIPSLITALKNSGLWPEETILDISYDNLSTKLKEIKETMHVITDDLLGIITINGIKSSLNQRLKERADNNQAFRERLIAADRNQLGIDGVISEITAASIRESLLLLLDNLLTKIHSIVAPRFTIGLTTEESKDVSLVGGKGASLAELITIVPEMVVQEGFVVTTDGYDRFIKENSLSNLIKELDLLSEKWQESLQKNDIEQNQKELEKRIKNKAEEIRLRIQQSIIPQQVRREIEENYSALLKGKKNIGVFVRSSATSEDSKDASAAGQHKTEPNLKGIDNVLEGLKNCWLSLFSDEAVFYRINKGVLNHSQVKLGLVILPTIDAQSAGTVFTVHPATGEEEIFIEANLGLGESVVSGNVTPDTYRVLNTGELIKKLGSKTQKVVTKEEGGVEAVKTSQKERESFALSEKQIIQLTDVVNKIKTYYRANFSWKYIDVEFAFEKDTGKLYILQVRPETGWSKIEEEVKRISPTGPPDSDVRGKIIFNAGETAWQGQVSGKIIVIEDISNPPEINKGDIIILKNPDPRWTPLLIRAGGIITEEGGLTSHAAIIAKEYNIPCVVQATGAKGFFKNLEGKIVTLDAANHRVYESGGLLLGEEDRKRFKGLIQDYNLLVEQAI